MYKCQSAAANNCGGVQYRATRSRATPAGDWKVALDPIPSAAPATWLPAKVLVLLARGNTERLPFVAEPNRPKPAAAPPMSIMCSRRFGCLAAFECGDDDGDALMVG